MKWTFVAWLASAFLCMPVAHATAVDTLDVDLNALIDTAAASKNRFAVDIAHPISANNAGTVSGTSAWTYSVRVPGAISMSFHASEVRLPGAAILTVTNGGTTTTYRSRDINRGELWGRPLLGDTLTFSLSGVAAGLYIESFQAGYRAIGGVVPNHVHYKALATTSDCGQNYSCNATDANQGPARATVAVLVGNQYMCTGTLLNDTSKDAIPYVLTARHCQNGKMGGGNPDAASAVTVYWDAVTSCGSTLGSIYESTAVTQFGAVTVVEQQDAWLIRLNAAPAASDAYFAGWDATGAVFNGGYSIHHALGNNKQYVGWYGQAVYQPMARATVGVNYESTFWGLVNGFGNIGAGSSGSAVFDSANRVVGSATLAQLVGGANTAGVCPVPNDSTPTAQYTALAGVWTSTADATSATGDVTLQSVLDPTNTGKAMIDGVTLMPMTLTADTDFLRTDQRLTLSWNVPGALACTASGGQSGDGWAGAKAASGSVKVSSLTGGHVEYALSCGTANGVGRAVTAADWTYVQPVAWIGVDASSVTIGGTINLNWYANVGPCTASGGQSGDGWAGSKDASGIQTVTASRAGTTVFTLTCGTWGQVASYKASVTVVVPSSPGSNGTESNGTGAAGGTGGTVGASGTGSAGGTAGADGSGDGSTADGSGDGGTAGASGSSAGGAAGTAGGASGGSAGAGPQGASVSAASEVSGGHGGGGALDPGWLGFLSVVLFVKARATRWSPAAEPRELPEAAHRSCQ